MTLRGEELKAFLDEIHLCHWATVDGRGDPWARPLWYLYADRAFWFTTRTEARRTGADAVGSRVAVSIASEERPYRAVVMQGTPEVLSEGRDEWLERIATRYGKGPGLRWLARALKEPDRVVMRMVPDRLITWDYSKPGPHLELSADDLP
jgi:nitroimidazol reductase NimA-like FMN-containing flavoprotein (pyridoxamine 5'-phosphate oxidase superfamily)